MKKFFIALVAILVLGLLAIPVLDRGYLWPYQDAGNIKGAGLATAVVQEREALIKLAKDDLNIENDKVIYFGDFHVHSTFSADAMLFSLPILGGEGVRPIADACDFARYCSNLDFFSMNDHAELLTTRQWIDTIDSLQACAATNEDSNPDLTPFVGWEWTQQGSNAFNHYGHKNVIFKSIDDEELPTRPIGAITAGEEGTNIGTANLMPSALRISTQLIAPIDEKVDFGMAARYFYASSKIMDNVCPDGVDVRDLPNDCKELTKTPKELFNKLNEWNFPTLVIPHGAAWGIYTPMGVSWDKQLADHQDENLNILLEVYSGHGNSEEFRDFTGIIFNPDGTKSCPATSENYVPGCQKAGELIYERCIEAGLLMEECQKRAKQAKQYYVDHGVRGFLTVPNSEAADWLDSGQCRDCYFGSFNYRPKMSAQYALALTNFDDPLSLKRFKFGFIGSSDVHSAQPGTGYKQIFRTVLTDSRGPINEDVFNLLGSSLVDHPENQDPTRPADPGKMYDLPGFFQAETERIGSYLQTGGLVAVHAKSRHRNELWDAIQNREVYGTSGEKILLWFDLEENEKSYAMGSEVITKAKPNFRVKAVGSHKQKPGCPEYVTTNLDPKYVEDLCKGECYNPSDERYIIEKIEIIKVTPQLSPDEKITNLIQDPWRTFECPESEAGCIVYFSDEDYETDNRDATYYARVLQEPTGRINAGRERCEYDENGNCIKVNICYGDFRTDPNDNCLTEEYAKAWSSPIYLLTEDRN